MRSFKKNVSAILVVIVFAVLAGGSIDENDTKKEKKNVAQTEKQLVEMREEVDEIKVVFTASDFNQKSVESLRDKYKEFITFEDVNELPIVSHLEFKKDGISANSSYSAPEKMIRHVRFIFSDEKCDSKNPISKKEAEKLLKRVGVPFDAEKWELQGTGMIKKLVAEEYEGWGKIFAMCSLDGERFLSFKSYNQEELKEIEKEKENRKRVEKIEKQFSAWDGSHTKLKRFIKSAMNDEKSFKHIKTSYVDKGDYLIVVMQYSGKNAFNATVKGLVKVKTDIETGDILEVLEKY